jgi:hypothetical protein|nr:MAG TPA: hypothetical protein [Caudoviricetes sp.]
MPGELVILNEQLQILFPICDEIGIIIQQEGLNINTIRSFVDSKITGAYYTEGEIYIKNEYGRSIITYNDSGMVTLQVELNCFSGYGEAFNIVYKYSLNERIY